MLCVVAGLYPLGEEGQYGPPPSALPPPLPGYKKRERKPKVYASYAVSHDCEAHGEKLSRQMVPARRASSYTRSPPTPSPSPARQRSNSFRQPSPSVQSVDYNGRADWKGSLRSTQSPARSYRASSNSRKTSRQSQRDSMSPSRTMSGSPEPPPSPQQLVKRPERRSVPSEGTDWGYTSYNNFTTSRGATTTNRSSSYAKYSNQVRDSSFDESYDDFGQNYSFNNNSYSSKTKVGRRTEHFGFLSHIFFLASESRGDWRRGLGFSQVRNEQFTI